MVFVFLRINKTELCEAALLTRCLSWVRGTFGLGVLRHVFGIRYVVSVLVINRTEMFFWGGFLRDSK